MVALGMFQIIIVLLGAILLWRKKLFSMPWLLWVFVFAVLAPQLANQLGWLAAEVGRQPWIVYGLLKTADAYSPTVSAGEVMTSLIMFGLIYALLTVLFIFLLNEKIKHGPDEEKKIPEVKAT